MTRPPEAAPQPNGVDAGWRNGWYLPARPLPSPNCEARPDGAVIDLIVVHSISLPPGEFGNGNVQRLFTNTLDWDSHPYFMGIKGLRVSSHFFISRRAEIWQFVSCNDRAWHAGHSAFHGRANCNDYSIGIELEGLEGNRFALAQYHALASLCLALAKKYPVQHIAGHEHVAPGRKFDPGAGFDWCFLRDALVAAGAGHLVLACTASPSQKST